jgi:hypothetical protein
MIYGQDDLLTGGSMWCSWGKDLWIPDVDDAPCEAEGVEVLNIWDAGLEFWLCKKHLLLLEERID